MALTSQDKKDMQDISELKVRQYFDQFLKDTFPRIMQEHVSGCKHGKSFNRFKWMLAGAMLVLGIIYGGGPVAAKLVALIG